MLNVHETIMNNVQVVDVKSLIDNSINFIETSVETMEFRNEVNIEILDYEVIGNQIEIDVKYYVYYTRKSDNFNLVVRKNSETKFNIAKRIINKVVILERLRYLGYFKDADYTLD